MAGKRRSDGAHMIEQNEHRGLLVLSCAGAAVTEVPNRAGSAPRVPENFGRIRRVKAPRK